MGASGGTPGVLAAGQEEDGAGDWLGGRRTGGRRTGRRATGADLEFLRPAGRRTGNWGSLTRREKQRGPGDEPAVSAGRSGAGWEETWRRR